MHAKNLVQHTAAADDAGFARCEKDWEDEEINVNSSFYAFRAFKFFMGGFAESQFEPH